MGLPPKVQKQELFVTQGFDGVEFGGFPGGVEAENDSDKGGDRYGGDYCAGAGAPSGG